MQFQTVEKQLLGIAFFKDLGALIRDICLTLVHTHCMETHLVHNMVLL